MTCTPGELGDGVLHELLTRAVVPRPIFWVTTLNSGAEAASAGLTNLAPFSAAVVLSGPTPLLLLGIGRHATVDGLRPKRTLLNALHAGEFVANLPDAFLLPAVVRTADVADACADRIALAGVRLADCIDVRTPRVLECRIAFECRVQRHIELDEAHTDLLIGAVVRMWLPSENASRLRGQPGALLSNWAGALGIDWYTCPSGLRYVPNGPPK